MAEWYIQMARMPGDTKPIPTPMLIDLHVGHAASIYVCMPMGL